MKTLIYRGEKAGANLGGLFFASRSSLSCTILFIPVSFPFKNNFLSLLFIFFIQFAEIVQLNLIISIFGLFFVVIMRASWLFSQLLKF